MDFGQIVQLISTVGFPIVCCLIMAWYVRYYTDQEIDEIAKLNEQHRQEMSEVTTALNNNTLAIQKLCDKLEG